MVRPPYERNAGSIPAMSGHQRKDAHEYDRTRASSCGSPTSCNQGGIRFSTAGKATMLSNHPAVPPMAASTPVSIKSWRVSVARSAPIAARIAQLSLPVLCVCEQEPDHVDARDQEHDGNCSEHEPQAAARRARHVVAQVHQGRPIERARNDVRPPDEQRFESECDRVHLRLRLLKAHTRRAPADYIEESRGTIVASSDGIEGDEHLRRKSPAGRRKDEGARQHADDRVLACADANRSSEDIRRACVDAHPQTMADQRNGRCAGTEVIGRERSPVGR